jgi:exopolysaccharide production protein ExoZ
VTAYDLSAEQPVHRGFLCYSSRMERGRTLFTIQALRALAAASVVVHHILAVAVQKAGYQFRFPSAGAAGVDLFFLINGFIMMYTHFNDFGEVGSSAAFISRRLIRVVPLYWIATTATIVLILVIPSAFSTQRLDWDNVAPSYLLLLSREPDGSLNTILPTGWTLGYEMYFSRCSRFCCSSRDACF